MCPHIAPPLHIGHLGADVPEYPWLEFSRAAPYGSEGPSESEHHGGAAEKDPPSRPPSKLSARRPNVQIQPPSPRKPPVASSPSSPPKEKHTPSSRSSSKACRLSDLSVGFSAPPTPITPLPCSPSARPDYRDEDEHKPPKVAPCDGVVTDFPTDEVKRDISEKSIGAQRRDGRRLGGARHREGSIITDKNLKEAFRGLYGRHNMVYLQDEEEASRPKVPPPDIAEGDGAGDDSQKPMDWVMAMALPNPEYVACKPGISMAQGEYIYGTCFKGEEYDSRETCLSQQNVAQARERMAFMSIFRMLPDSADGRGKVFGERGLPESEEKDMPTPTSPTSPTPSSCANDFCVSECGPVLPAPRSFLGLVRHAIVTKLVMHCGLRVRCVLSKDRLQIILLIGCTVRNLMWEADRQGFPTELDPRSADPESLEPCTRTYYPLLHWYFFHKPEDSNTEMFNAFSEALQAIWAASDSLPRKIALRHEDSVQFWGTFRAMVESDRQILEHPCLSSASQSLVAMVKDFGSQVHLGRKPEEVRDAFIAYLERKAKEPLASPIKLLKKVNEEQHRSGREKLRNYYDNLGLDQMIPPHCAFKLHTFFTEHSRPWVWRHFTTRLLQPAPDTAPSYTSTPFRAHQIIILVNDIIGRQLDVELLIELGCVNSLFPLDTADKVQRPNEWLLETDDDTGATYFFNVNTRESCQVQEDDLMGSTHGSAPSACAMQPPLPSELLVAWGWPDASLPPWKRLLRMCESLVRPPSIHVVREYYGEEIALYFAITQHLCWWCLLPAGIGIVEGLVQLASTDATSGPRALLHLLHGIFVALWGPAWLKSWQRREAVLAAAWGQRGIQRLEEDTVRPAFRGIPRRSPVDFSNDMDRFEVTCISFGRLGQLPRRIASFALIAVLSVLHVTALVYILTLRKVWMDSTGLDLRSSNFMCGWLISLEMFLFSGINSVLSPMLNNCENYRTSGEYISNFNIKQCVIEFVNQFSLFFYLGFFKGAWQGCIDLDSEEEQPALLDSGFQSMDMDSSTCLGELQNSLQIVLLANASMNVIEITGPAWIMPLLRKLMSRRPRDGAQPQGSEGSGGGKGAPPSAAQAQTTSSAEQVQTMLDKELYSTLEVSGTYADYIEIVVYFGHISLFSIVFPFAALVVLCLLIVELRVDGHKLFYTVRRPMPRGAENIGAWVHAFSFVSWVSVLTNSFLVVWGLDSFSNPLFSMKLTPSAKWLICVCSILVLASVQAMIKWLVPNVPERLRVLLGHHQCVCQQQLLTETSNDVDQPMVALDSLDTTVYCEGRNTGQRPKRYTNSPTMSWAISAKSHGRNTAAARRSISLRCPREPEHTPPLKASPTSAGDAFRCIPGWNSSTSQDDDEPHSAKSNRSTRTAESCSCRGTVHGHDEPRHEHTVGRGMGYELQPCQ